MSREKTFVVPPMRHCVSCGQKLSIYNKSIESLCFKLECKEKFDRGKALTKSDLALVRGIAPSANTTMGEIVALVARHFGHEPAVLCGPSKDQKYTKPRQVAYYLLRHDARMTFVEIGACMGGRRKGNVCTYYQAVLDNSSHYAPDIDEIRSQYKTVEREKELALDQ